MNQVQSLLQKLELEPHVDPLEDFAQLPGLYRRWELEQVVDDGDEYRIECAGELADKTRLFCVFRRVPRPGGAELGVPVTLVFDAQKLAIRARLVRIDNERPQLLAVTLDGDAEYSAACARVRDIVSRTRSLAEIDDPPEAEVAATAAAAAAPLRDSTPG